jgi:hypothetical protein
MFAFEAGAIIGLAIIVHYADVVKYLRLCYIRVYRAVPVLVGFTVGGTSAAMFGRVAVSNTGTG